MYGAALAAGFAHSLVLCPTVAPKTHVFGLNTSGQLGLGGTDPQLAQIVIGGPLTPFTGSTFIAAGNAHSFLIKGGIAYGFGSNALGQLGWSGKPLQTTPHPVPNLTGVLAVSCGADFTLFLVVDGGDGTDTMEPPVS